MAICCLLILRNDSSYAERTHCVDIATLVLYDDVDAPVSAQRISEDARTMGRLLFFSFSTQKRRAVLCCVVLYCHVIA